MEWLLDQSEKYRSQLRSGPFFRKLADVEKPGQLTWIHQLVHQSREFTQALCLRYSLCSDKNYKSIFAEHAFEEADHPDQLLAWMGKHGFLENVGPEGVPPTQDTVNCLAYCWRSALREPHDVQVVSLNVISEGVAFDFYSAVIPVLKKLGILSGRYWSVHAEVDTHHLQMGLDRCGDVSPDSPQGLHYQRVLWHSASLYHQMLASWVGEQVAPLQEIASSRAIAAHA
jgi:Iron-containing redox enzyme